MMRIAMITDWRGFGLAIGLAACVMTPSSLDAGENYTLCGGSPGGLWSLLGAGMDAVVKEIDPSSTVTYQTSSGGFANIVQVRAGKCDMAIVHVGEAVIARNGQPPFSAPTEGVKAVAVLYDWAPMQWVIGKEFAEKHNLKSIGDLKKAKPPLDLVVNRRGILPSILAEESLKHAGITFADIESWGGSIQYQGSQTAAGIMKDRKADMWVNATFVGSGRIRSIAESRDVTLLSVPDPVIEGMAGAYGSMPKTVEAGAYPWLDSDIRTFGARAILIVADGMDEGVVKEITTAMINHVDKIQGVHKAMGALSVDVMRSQNEIAYHPGAEAAYRDAGS